MLIKNGLMNATISCLARACHARLDATKKGASGRTGWVRARRGMPRVKQPGLHHSAFSTKRVHGLIWGGGLLGVASQILEGLRRSKDI